MTSVTQQLYELSKRNLRKLWLGQLLVLKNRQLEYMFSPLTWPLNPNCYKKCYVITFVFMNLQTLFHNLFHFPMKGSKKDRAKTGQG